MTEESTKTETNADEAAPVDGLVMLQKLKELIAAQCSDGNWDYDSYMQGLANGMILAEATLEDKTPVFLDAPDVWLKDIPSTEKPTVAGAT